MYDDEERVLMGSKNKSKSSEKEKKRKMNNKISQGLWFVLLVDGTHCVEHHGEPTDCLQEVCFRSEQIQTQIDLRFPPAEIYTCHEEDLKSPQRQNPLIQLEIQHSLQRKLKITALH